MSKLDKRLDKWRNNPRAVRFEEIHSVLLKFGFTCKQPSGGSSHFVYRRAGRYPVTIAHKKPFIHSNAVKEVLQAIEEILTGEGEE
jgi:hypothetical protein